MKKSRLECDYCRSKRDVRRVLTPSDWEEVEYLETLCAKCRQGLVDAGIPVKPGFRVVH